MRLLFGSLFHVAARRRHRPRRDLADADARRRLRLADHRRLDRMAEERLGRYRSLCARHYRAHRRIADSASATASPSTPAPTMPEILSTAAAASLVSGMTPAARYWTLTLYDPDGRLVANAIDRHSFTSDEIVRDIDGRFAITVGAAGAARQLAADRRHRTVRAGVAALRHADRRRHAHHQRRTDAGDRAKGLLMIRAAVVDLSARSCSAASCICRLCWRCRRRRSRTPIRGSRR